MEKVLEVINAEKYYGDKGCLTKALDDISFSVEKGEFVGIMGASGSGKSTLLNCISTIDTLTAGKVLINGTDVNALKGKKLDEFRRDMLGFIFQEFNLLDSMTAYDNIALALSIQNRPADEIDAKIREMADILGITEVLNKYPYQMSGGQKQRVAAARAVVTDPELILADEPTGALDSKAARALLECMVRMNAELKSTVLMVTHDAFSASYASRIIFIKDGRIFNEIDRNDGESRKEFFNRIVKITTVLGGDLNDLV